MSLHTTTSTHTNIGILPPLHDKVIIQLKPGADKSAVLEWIAQNKCPFDEVTNTYPYLPQIFAGIFCEETLSRIPQLEIFQNDSPVYVHGGVYIGSSGWF